jgi:hypothetical protein
VKIHTQEEVAAILRRSVATVYRLRLARALASIPGRPVTITDAALQAYIARASAAPADQAAASATDPDTGQGAFMQGCDLARRVAARKPDVPAEQRGRLLGRIAAKAGKGAR